MDFTSYHSQCLTKRITPSHNNCTLDLLGFTTSALVATPATAKLDKFRAPMDGWLLAAALLC